MAEKREARRPQRDDDNGDLYTRTTSRHQQRLVLDRDLDDLPAFMKEMGERIRIDRMKLDDAVMWQAEAQVRIGDCHAMIKSQRDDAKDRIKEVEAELDEEIRREMAQRGDKVTETQVKNLILRARKYHDASRKHSMLARDEQRLANLRDAYKDRSYMVREMVTLHMGGYFADRAGKPRDAAYGYRERDSRR